MSPLRTRTFLLPPAMRREYPMAKAFLAPQREHVKHSMPERPPRHRTATWTSWRQA